MGKVGGVGGVYSSFMNTVQNSPKQGYSFVAGAMKFFEPAKESNRKIQQFAIFTTVVVVATIVCYKVLKRTSAGGSGDNNQRPGLFDNNSKTGAFQSSTSSLSNPLLNTKKDSLLEDMKTAISTNVTIMQLPTDTVHKPLSPEETVNLVLQYERADLLVQITKVNPYNIGGKHENDAELQEWTLAITQGFQNGFEANQNLINENIRKIENKIGYREELLLDENHFQNFLLACKGLVQFETDYKNNADEYLKIENAIRKDHGTKVPKHAPRGPLHYAMSLETMKQVMAYEFQKLAREGRIIRNLAFEAHPSKDYWERTLIKQSGEEVSPELTQIWSASYLEKGISEKGLQNELGILTPILVIDTFDKELEVTVVFGSADAGSNISPITTNVKGAFVYVNKMLTSKSIEENSSQAITIQNKLKDLGVIRGHGLVAQVDTSSKDNLVWLNQVNAVMIPAQNPGNKLVLPYLERRFLILNENKISGVKGDIGTNKITLKIPLADLGLRDCKMNCVIGSFCTSRIQPITIGNA